MDFFGGVAFVVLVSVAGGVVIGIQIASRRWARNADDYRRIEWDGRLYKVRYDE